ncbi:MAG: helix-turn-helix domain-containing protein [Minisyncoccia bacterium]|jgi:sugar-specific transcriptional regulator TrmB
MDAQMERFRNALISIGFSAKEAEVYLALLDIGKGTVSQITRKAKLNRTTGYDILDKLVGLGLARISGKEPKQEYAVESPTGIENIVKNRIAEASKNAEIMLKLIPQLSSIHNVAGRPQIRFYEGIEGLKQVYEDTLTSHEPIRAWATVEDMYKGLPGYFPKYYKRRAAHNISIRAIVPRTEMGLELVKRDKEEARETALIPLDKFYFSPEINVYDNKIMIASWREKLGIIIESAEIADALKKIFELSWAEAKRLSVQHSGMI